LICMSVWGVGVWLCPSHHCDNCGRTATMSCAFCPTAFCSEHFHDKVRLTEYYELACLKHVDVVLCEDPSVLKIFGLCKTAKASSSRKQQAKSVRRKSNGDSKQIRRDGGKDGKRDSEGRAVSENQTVKNKRKSNTPVLEPRDRNLKRSCRDREVKKKEPDPNVSLDDELSPRLVESPDDVKQHDKKKEQQRKFRESESGRKGSHGSQKEAKTVCSSSSLGLESLKKGKKSNKTSRDRRQHSTHSPDDDDRPGLKKVKNDSETFARDHSRCRTHEQDIGRRDNKRRRIQHSKSTAATLNFAANSSTPPLLLSDSAATARVDTRSMVKSASNSAAVASAKSLVDEPLFDNSDDEFPELVIDMPTI